MCYYSILEYPILLEIARFLGLCITVASGMMSSLADSGFRLRSTFPTLWKIEWDNYWLFAGVMGPRAIATRPVRAISSIPKGRNKSIKAFNLPWSPVNSVVNVS